MSAGSVVPPTRTPLSRSCMALTALLMTGIVSEVDAMTFTFDIGGEAVEGASNTTVIGGVGVRTESPETRGIGKGHLDPEVCGRGPDGKVHYQVCQGIFKDQIFPSQRIANAPGYASSNFDQGNLNYARGDVTQGGIRINQDLLLTWGNFGFFAKGIAFYDPFNYNFDEFHPSYINADNVDEVGYASMPGDEVIRAGANLSVLAPVIDQLGLPANIVTELLSNPIGIPVLGVRNDSRPCPASRNPSGGPCGLVYGPGGTVYKARKDKETRRLAGLGLLLQDLNVFGTFALPGERELLVKLGRQQVNWGESTIEFFDSLNVANPADLHNLFRLGGNGLDDFYQPVNMLTLSTGLFDGASISAFYQLEWQPLIVPAAGTFYSPVNIGTNNDGPNFVTTGFGQFPHDPDALGYQLDSPLTAITNTSSRIRRLNDREPDWENQFGIQFKYYAEWLNNGTDIGLYYANYHSRLPIASFYSTSRSCAKDVKTPVGFVTSCARWPIFRGILSPNDPASANPDETGDALALDSAAVVLEYPKNIQMYGISANTSFGDIAVQGEIAYRPDQPLQVALVDLVFAAYGPTLTNCHLPPGCVGSTAGLGVLPDGSVGVYGSSDFVGVNGVLGSFPDTIDAVVGALPGAGRSFPSFIIPYRGGVIGDNPANSYIRGWEEFETFTFDLGLTYVEGNTNFGAKLLRADQIIWLLEFGGVWVPDLPSLDQLQLEAPGIEYHASAGADGTGADGSRQACSTNVACNLGPDGLRFNPHQQDRGFYPDDISLGMSLVSQIRYESVLPGISIQPQIIFKYDLYNTTPGLASNYIEGRIIWDTGIEVRYKANLSFNFGYRTVAGGGVANNLGDRDEARVFLKYAF
ncbi:MAG: DUF1302 domain-containing protein [Panacagrimonas sp.]